MVDNLMEMLQSSLTPKLAGDASTYLGESPAMTRSAVIAAIPAVLAALARQGATTGGASEIFNMITSPQIDTGLAENPGGWLGGDARTANLLSQGSSLVRGLFGDRTGAIADAVSSVSGMKMASVSTMLSLAVPAIFSWLKRYLAQGRVDAGSLASLLGGQGEHLRTRIDDRVSSALGFASPGALLTGLASGVTGYAAAAGTRAVEAAEKVGTQAAAIGERVRPEPPSRRGWLWGLAGAVGLLLLLGLLSYWTVPVERAATTATTTAANVGAVVAGAIKSIDLPGGAKIDVTTGGFVDSLAAFLASKDAAMGRSFVFDDLHFETGSATLSARSDRQLTALAAVLNAYGGVAVNVAGYSDNVGDAAANKKLSADRAAAVKQALVSKGIPESRVTDAGFGEEKPVAPNDTEDGRAKNRRVELVVLKR
jgi:outer membrane protein OmpA-like peptidoglycan-associated protein